MKANIKVGEEVYLPELKQFGIVKEVNATGRPKSVEIQTVDGPKVINVLNMIVKVGEIILMAWPVFENLFIKIKRWFS